MTNVEMAESIDRFLNNFNNPSHTGIEVGKELRTTHRTLQRSAVAFALGILEGISEQERTDARNEVAIRTAKKIKKMREDGDLPLGSFIQLWYNIKILISKEKI